jgi:nucleoside triphosphatase
MKMRVGVVAIITNTKDEILLCKMPVNRGAYPGQWALPGGGIEAGEKMWHALKREILEEVGLQIQDIEPFWFQDDERDKIHPEKATERLYMIHLVFDARAVDDLVTLDDQEFEAFAWVGKDKVGTYDLNDATLMTFEKKGWI